jgi:hypothetical protein
MIIYWFYKGAAKDEGIFYLMDPPPKLCPWWLQIGSHLGSTCLRLLRFSGLYAPAAPFEETTCARLGQSLLDPASATPLLEYFPIGIPP